MKNIELTHHKQPEYLDDYWYKKFQTLSYGFGIHIRVNLEQKKKFIKGELENPEIEFTVPNIDNADENEQHLLDFKKEIISSSDNDVIKQMYRWKINEMIAQHRLARAVASQDMRRYKRYTEFIYGKPSPDIFAYTNNFLHQKISECLISENPKIRAAAMELQEQLPQNMPSPKIVDLPSEKDFKFAQYQTLTEMGALIDFPALAEEQAFESWEIAKIFEKALASLGATGWKTFAEREGHFVHVDYSRKGVVIPPHLQATYDGLRGLVLHEGSHVNRKLQQGKSRLLLLKTGLDRYIKGEEGIACLREDIVSDKMQDFSGLEGHLAISLAYGLDGVPRNFRGVYTILEKYYNLQGLLNEKRYWDAEATPSTMAWKRCMRTFLGTDCKTPGVCSTKDVVYREGSIGVWNVIRDNPREMLRFNVGAYDPSNSRHIWILDQLGITEADLEITK